MRQNAGAESAFLTCFVGIAPRAFYRMPSAGIVPGKSIEMNNGREESIFFEKLDTANIGAFGHSFDGAASGQLCLEDIRIKAFINMDGSPIGDAPEREISQPFMVLTCGGEEKH